MKRKIAILQSNYIPWRGYFDLIRQVDVFVLYDVVKYTKNDWRNRNIIYSKNGKQWLTIPIEKDAVKLPINEVTIKDPSWQLLHFKTLKITYSNAPFFYQIEELLKEVYLDKKWKYLSELNHFLIQKIASLLQIRTQFVDAKNLLINGERIERLISIIKQLGGNYYLSGPSAKDYLMGNEHFFADSGIELVYMKYPEYPSYLQRNSEYFPYVSILDVLVHLPIDSAKEAIFGY